MTPIDFPRPSGLLRGAPWVVIAILAITCIGLGAELHDSFVKLQLARLFPTGYHQKGVGSVLKSDGGPTIAFWGDSRAAQWDKSGLGCQLQPRDLAGGGLTSAQLVLQLRGAPTDRDTYAVVQIGINDLHPLGAVPELQAEIVAQLRANVAVIRDELLRRSDTVVLSTVIPPARVPLVRRLTWDAETSRRIQEINQLIRSQADGRRVLVLDAYTLLVRPDGYLDDKYVGDFFLHLNDLAYSRLNEQLRALIASPSSGCT